LGHVPGRVVGVRNGSEGCLLRHQAVRLRIVGVGGDAARVRHRLTLAGGCVGESRPPPRLANSGPDMGH